jgi:hypothetical protein
VAADGAAKAAAQRLTGGDSDGGIRTIDERRLHQRMGGGGEASAGLSGRREVRRPVAAAFGQQSCQNSAGAAHGSHAERAW